MAGSGNSGGDTTPTAQIGKNLMAYLPIILVCVSVIASATAAQLQIGSNRDAVARVETQLELRVPKFLYELQMDALEKDMIELAGGVEINEEVIDQLEKGSDQINATLKLEIERLRASIREADKEQKAQLQLILKQLELIQQQREN